MKETGAISEVWFDSGGYFVQMGRIAYDEMYYRLLDFYRVNTWADWYVLPDYVPTSSDSSNDVWHKVRRTADGGRLFFLEMPDSLKSKALLVMQGHTIEQIEYCLTQYLAIGAKRLGFGSFGTNGKASSVNSVTPAALDLLVHLSKILKQSEIHLHAFGVGTPPVIYLLNMVGVNSFDSVGWMKTAGYGKIYMPFVRAYNITYRDLTARGLKRDEFLELKKSTGHSCHYCQSFEVLQQDRFARIMHNLTVVLDTVETAGKNHSLVKDLLKQYSPLYAHLLEGLKQ
ncbi:MAG: hypothetical protein JXA33_22885 [Anaerolineae bacterium]|nr:hypothetical protein [Anaerolineae bacterium]